MRVVRYSDRQYEQRLRQLTAPSSLFDPGIEQRVRDIADGVRDKGDEALQAYTQRFDGARLTPDQFRVTAAELNAAAAAADPSLRAALKLADKNVAAYARRCLRKSWQSRNAQGAVVGEKFDPFQRVGIYVPGGAAPLVSTVIMTVSLARVAGCPEIVVCTPCRADGSVNPDLLFAAKAAGATEIYRIGGAQAIAAMAFGTPRIPRVQKIFGPGNAYVVAAKRLLVGYVAIDLLPGPSELLVLADDSADPRFIAIDLLAQAEHGSGHERVWLVTPSGRLLRAVEKEITRQLPQQPRRNLIQQVLQRDTWLIQTRTLDDAIALTNQLAPEHLEVMTRRPAAVVKRLTTAGAIFVGPHTPTVLGDYVAGPSHTLPTGGAGRSFPGLTADMFQRRTSVVQYNKTALRKSLKAVETFAKAEGLSSHGESARIRLR